MAEIYNKEFLGTDHLLSKTAVYFDLKTKNSKFYYLDSIVSLKEFYLLN